MAARIPEQPSRGEVSLRATREGTEGQFIRAWTHLQPQPRDPHTLAQAHEGAG